jgi:hypothetical protein
MPTSPGTLSALISRTSAGFLFLAGLALLFGSDRLLPLLVPGAPPASAWLGQFIAAAWLGVANLNWLSRSALLGGIYGRPVVATNLTLYTVSALGSLKALGAATAPPVVWLVAAPMAAFAVVYGALLLRGPFDLLGGEVDR